ncbi:MAG: hypothetical protein QOE93_289, partial [Actinomycetota bacterium]|nr:hypothetical protein [Actinomycetota bacterium]
SLLPAHVTVVDLGAEATLNVNTRADLERADGLVHGSPGGAC